MSIDPDVGAETAADGPQVIDSGPVVLQATTNPERDEEVRDGGDRPGAGE